MTNQTEEILPLIKEHLPKDKEIVSVTEVGSGMWGMREISSDYDIVVIYSGSMVDFISENKYDRNLPNRDKVMIEGKEYDFSYMEFGHLINLLKKNNINAIWATLSPNVIATSLTHKKLVDYIKMYPTKGIMPSLEGMVYSQLSDATKRSKVKSPEKNIKTAMRTVRFGETLYWEGVYKFEPVKGTYTDAQVREALADLKERMKNLMVAEIPHKGLEQILARAQIRTPEKRDRQHIMVMGGDMMKVRYTVTFTMNCQNSGEGRESLADNLRTLESDELKYVIHPRCVVLEL